MFERPKWSKVDVRLQGDPRGRNNVDSPGEQCSKDRTLEIFGCRYVCRRVRRADIMGELLQASRTWPANSCQGSLN